MPIQSYLEIGVREGDSLISILNHFQIKELCLCDTWGTLYGGSGRGNCDHIVSLLQQYSIDYVNILNGKSQEQIPQFFSEFPEKIFDLIFIDGDHSYEGCLADLKNTIEHGKITAVHDIRHPEHLYLKDLCYGFFNQIKDKYSLVDDGENCVLFILKSLFNV